MSPQDFKFICQEMAEFYDSKCFTEKQLEVLYRCLRFCQKSEIKQAIDLMTMAEMKMPNMATFLAYTRPMQAEAAKRRKNEIIQKHGRCEYCQGSGMIIVVEHKDPDKIEKTMRCGECQVAEVTGVLKHVQEYTDLGSKGIEPTILSKSLNANPGRGRIDEIKRMPAHEVAELLKKEPWLYWPLTLYGNRAIKLEPEVQEFDDDISEFLE